jgi:hypothetical protein
VQNKDNQETYSGLKSDARKAILAFLIINICVVLLALTGERQFVFAAIFVQFALVVFWLLPVFLYQVLVKKQALVLSAVKALVSYRYLIGQVQWP